MGTRNWLNWEENGELKILLFFFFPIFYFSSFIPFHLEDKVIAVHCVNQRPVVLAILLVLVLGAALGKKTLLAQSVMIFMLWSGVMEMPAAVMVSSGQISTDGDHDCG